MKLAFAFAGLAALAVGASASAQDAVAQGKKLYQSRCGVCHIAPDANPQATRLGPSLQGVIGRKAGTLSSYPRYSTAMKAYAQPWSEATLDAFLESPHKLVKGTTMGFIGLKSPQDRAAVIAYLKSATPKR